MTVHYDIDMGAPMSEEQKRAALEKVRAYKASAEGQQTTARNEAIRAEQIANEKLAMAQGRVSRNDGLFTGIDAAKAEAQGATDLVTAARNRGSGATSPAATPASTISSGASPAGPTVSLPKITGLPAPAVSPSMADSFSATSISIGAGKPSAELQAIYDKVTISATTVGPDGRTTHVADAAIQTAASGKLAETLFTGAPLDDLLTVDAYGLDNSQILNTIDKLRGFGDGAIGNLVGGIKDTFGSAKGIFSKGLGGVFEIDPKTLTARVTDSLNSVSQLRNMNGDLRSIITNPGAFSGLGGPGAPINNLMSQVSTVINDVERIRDFSDVRSARDLVNVMNHLTGGSAIGKLFDLGAETQLLSGVFRDAIESGLPEAIEMLANGNFLHKDAGYYALRNNITIAVEQSELQVVEQMIITLGVDRLLADKPDTIEALIRNYRFPAGTATTDYDAEYLKLKSVLDKLNPNWGKVKRGGEWLSDLTYFTQASPDALALFYRQPELETVIMISSTYPSMDLVGSIKLKYPEIVF